MVLKTTGIAIVNFGDTYVDGFKPKKIKKIIITRMDTGYLWERKEITIGKGHGEALGFGSVLFLNLDLW